MLLLPNRLDKKKENDDSVGPRHATRGVVCTTGSTQEARGVVKSENWREVYGVRERSVYRVFFFFLGLLWNETDNKPMMIDADVLHLRTPHKTSLIQKHFHHCFASLQYYHTPSSKVVTTFI